MHQEETQFSVNRAQTEGFAKVWKTPGGIHLTHSPATIQFATDFANVVLRGFIDMCKHQAQEHAKQAEAEQKPWDAGQQTMAEHLKENAGMYEGSGSKDDPIRLVGA